MYSYVATLDMNLFYVSGGLGFTVMFLIKHFITSMMLLLLLFLWFWLEMIFLSFSIPFPNFPTVLRGFNLSIISITIAFRLSPLTLPHSTPFGRMRFNNFALDKSCHRLCRHLYYIPPIQHEHNEWNTTTIHQQNVYLQRDITTSTSTNTITTTANNNTVRVFVALLIWPRWCMLNTHLIRIFRIIMDTSNKINHI